MNEEILISELRSRNTVAFDYVFNYYYSGLCVFAHRYVPEREVVEDIVQDFFVHFWMESPRLQIKTSLKSYLFTSIHNRCLDWQKHRKISDKYRKNVLLDNEVSEIRTEEMVVESELRLAIHKGLEHCAPRAREIFEMSRMKGLSNQQIAEELGLSKHTVELQISNALKILRNSLRDYIPVWMITWLLS